MTIIFAILFFALGGGVVWYTMATLPDRNVKQWAAPEAPAYVFVEDEQNANLRAVFMPQPQTWAKRHPYLTNMSYGAFGIGSYLLVGFWGLAAFLIISGLGRKSTAMVVIGVILTGMCGLAEYERSYQAHKVAAVIDLPELPFDVTKLSQAEKDRLGLH